MTAKTIKELSEIMKVYKICEIDKKGKILFEYYNESNLEKARALKKHKIRHLTESNNLSGTVVILDNNNKIVN